jgi:hypothetical protein
MRFQGGAAWGESRPLFRKVFMSDLETLLACLLGDDFEDMVACFGADAERAKSQVCNPVNAKARRSPQERAFKAAKRAVREGDFAALGKMIKSPRQANWYASDRAWCLLDEAIKSGSLAMVQWLLERGANPNTLFRGDRLYDLSLGPVTGIYFSPFASAISAGSQQMVECMLAYGADINLPVVYEDDDDNTTCAYLAEKFGMWPCVEAFLIGQSASAAEAVSNSTRL